MIWKNFAGNPQSLATLILEGNLTDTERICRIDISIASFFYIENFIKPLKQQDEIVENSARFKKHKLTKLFLPSKPIRAIIDYKKK
jgi:hypothetical protein